MPIPVFELVTPCGNAGGGGIEPRAPSSGDTNPGDGVGIQPIIGGGGPVPCEHAPIKFETLVSSLTKQVPKVLEQTGAASVAFDVQTVNGKVVLKALPKK